jgi:hypothetical protein
MMKSLKAILRSEVSSRTPERNLIDKAAAAAVAH